MTNSSLHSRLRAAILHEIDTWNVFSIARGEELRPFSTCVRRCRTLFDVVEHDRETAVVLPPLNPTRVGGQSPWLQSRFRADAAPLSTRPFQRPGRSLKADWLDERPTSNGAVRERVEPARLGGRWFGADGPPSPPPSPRDLQCCLKVRQVRHRAPPRRIQNAPVGGPPHRSQITD